MKLLSILLAAGLLFAALPSVVSAQEDAVATITARLVTVKGDRVAQWESLQRERTLALRARGIGFRHVFRSLRGTTLTYLIITPGTRSNVPVTRNWVTAVNGMIVSGQVSTLRAYPELGTNTSGSTAITTDFVRIRIRTVPPGRSNDYYEWQRDELVPALQTAGIGDTRVARIALGGNTNTWMRFGFIDSLPTLSGPNILAESMGVEEAQQMLDRGNALTSNATDVIYSYRADLSYDAN